MSVRSVSWKVRFTWCRHWRTLKMQDVMHLLCILETSDRRSQRHCLQNILTDRRCLSQQQKSAETTWFREEEMPTAACSMQAIT